MFRSRILIAILAEAGMSLVAPAATQGAAALPQARPEGGTNVSVKIISPSTPTASIPVMSNTPFIAEVTGNCSGLGCGVLWTVNGVKGGDSTFGTIGQGRSTNYSSPNVTPSPATFEITATSVANSSVSASVTVTITGPPIGISFADPENLDQELSVGGTMPLQAVVTGLANTAVNWTVNGVPNGDSTFGTISGTGSSVTYHAPASVPKPATFNVTAISVEDSKISASVKVTVAIGVVVSILKPALPVLVEAGSTVKMLAAITGVQNTGAGWTVNGISYGDSTYGTITGIGLSVVYNAPYSVPTPATFEVTVFSYSDRSKSASLMVTVLPATAECGSGNEALLDGQYAFNLTGFGAHGFDAVVGSIGADGEGHITGGEADGNGADGVHSTAAVYAGTYTIGPDYRGCATIVTNFGTYSTRFQLGAISNGVATAGHLMEFDAANAGAFNGTGQILMQAPGDFSAGLDGGYAHYLEGWDSKANARIVCGGVETSRGGETSDEEQTCNDGGTVNHTGPVTGKVGTYSTIDAHGRFTETVGSSHLVGYMVSSRDGAGDATAEAPAALILTTGSDPVLAGESFHQAGSFGKDSLRGDYVIYANGVDSATKGTIFFGLYSASGDGTLTEKAYYENDGGTWVTGDAQPSYSYSVDPYGDATLSTKTVSDAGHLYLSGAGPAVFIGADSSSSGGYAVLQTGSGTLGDSTLDGTYFGGTTEVSGQAAGSSGSIATLNGAGALAMIADDSSTASQKVDAKSAGTISVRSNGTITTSANPKQVTGVVIDADYFLLANNPSSKYPTILLFGPGGEQ